MKERKKEKKEGDEGRMRGYLSWMWKLLSLFFQFIPHFLTMTFSSSFCFFSSLSISSSFYLSREEISIQNLIHTNWRQEKKRPIHPLSILCITQNHHVIKCTIEQTSLSSSCCYSRLLFPFFFPFSIFWRRENKKKMTFKSWCECPRCESFWPWKYQFVAVIDWLYFAKNEKREREKERKKEKDKRKKKEWRERRKKRKMRIGKTWWTGLIKYDHHIHALPLSSLPYFLSFFLLPLSLSLLSTIYGIWYSIVDGPNR